MSELSLAPRTTIGAARKALATAFRSAGLDTPELDARVLVGHALALDHTALAAAPDRVIDDAALTRLAGYAARRLGREPVARIVGVKEFWGMPLALSEATLVPRPESETVVEAALDAAQRIAPREGTLRIADLGTGSGALLLALLRELPCAVGVGTDVSAQALATARANACALGLTPRAAFVNCDYGRALAGDFDIVISNPPYIASGAIAGLAPEVRDHDPPRALDGGEDGLAAYREIASDVRRLLATGGMLFAELGDFEGAAPVFARAGLRVEAEPRRDLAGIPRVLCARRDAADERE